MKKRKVVYISGSRADFGLLFAVLQAIEKSRLLDLNICATGLHLMPQFGYTVNEISKHFSAVTKLAAVFNSDDREGMARFIAEFTPLFFEYLKEEKPDFLLVQGDRVEMLAAALIGQYVGSVIAHTHGGDKTTTIDETARHTITKLAHIHLTATADSAKRVERLGEEKWRIHTVGAPSLDTITRIKLPSQKELFNFLELPIHQKFILVLQHPVTKQINQTHSQIEIILRAVKSFGLPVVVVYPNADPGGRKMIEVIEREKENSDFRLYPSLPYPYFLALEKAAAVWVGNSSAGIIESASFNTPVVNIGDRQSGRPDSGNVLHVGYHEEEIKKAIDKSLHDTVYLKKIEKVENIWGDGHASEKIVSILETIALDEKLRHKQITY